MRGSRRRCRSDWGRRRSWRYGRGDGHHQRPAAQFLDYRAVMLLEPLAQHLVVEIRVVQVFGIAALALMEHAPARIHRSIKHGVALAPVLRLDVEGKVAHLDICIEAKSHGGSSGHPAAWSSSLVPDGADLT